MVLASDLLIRPRASGIVIPPADIKKLADKTAEYVAKNGSNFEDLVLQKELSNPKFCFLQRGNTYRAYYEHKVAEYARGLVEVNVIEQEPELTQQPQKIDQPPQQIQREQKRVQAKAPPSDHYTVEPPRNLSQLDLDVIKQTASFVAKNGKKFLVSLTEKEKQNPQFEFLKPTHDLFQFFLNLVDAYTKCLNPKREDVDRLLTYVQDKSMVYQRCIERYEYENHQNSEKQKQQQIDDEEKQQMAMIDWNDFVVVEAIEFYDDDAGEATIEKQTQRFDRFDFAALDNQLNLRHQQQQQQPLPMFLTETIRPASKELVQEVHLHATTSKESKYETPAPPTPAEENVRIVKDYVRPVGQQDSVMVKCEICNRNFPKNQINEHIQIELQDPRYIEIKNEVLEKGKTTTIPTGQVIAKHLQQLKRKRPDIFNPAEEEEQIMGRDNYPCIILNYEFKEQKRQTPAPPQSNPPPPNMSNLIPPPPKPTDKKSLSYILPPPPKIPREQPPPPPPPQ